MRMARADIARRAKYVVLLLIATVGAIIVQQYVTRVAENTLPTAAAGNIIRDVAYGDLSQQKLDIYLPRDTSKAPVIVFFHGGTWIAGSKEGAADIGRRFADWGYVAVVVGYRLYPTGRFPDFMIDSARALVWVHENIRQYGGNPNAIFTSGHSAGAYNAAMLALDPHYLADAAGNTSWVRGVISLAGPYDFNPTDSDVQDVFLGTSRPAMDPLEFVDGKKPPILLITGDKDTVVPKTDSEKMAQRLQAAGNLVSLKIYPGMEHNELLAALTTGNRQLRDDIADFVKATTGR